MFTQIPDGSSKDFYSYHDDQCKDVSSDKLKDCENKARFKAIWSHLISYDAEKFGGVLMCIHGKSANWVRTALVTGPGAFGGIVQRGDYYSICFSGDEYYNCGGGKFKSHSTALTKKYGVDHYGKPSGFLDSNHQGGKVTQCTGEDTEAFGNGGVGGIPYDKTSTRFAQPVYDTQNRKQHAGKHHQIMKSKTHGR